MNACLRLEGHMGLLFRLRDPNRGNELLPLGRPSSSLVGASLRGIAFRSVSFF